MDDRHQLMDQLGIKEWLYFNVIDSSYAITEFRIDAVRDSICIQDMHDGDKWDYAAAAHSAKWMMDAIQDWYGR